MCCTHQRKIIVSGLKKGNKKKKINTIITFPMERSLKTVQKISSQQDLESPKDLILSILASRGIPPQHPLTTFFFFPLHRHTHQTHSLSSLSHLHVSFYGFFNSVSSSYSVPYPQISSSEFSLTKCSSPSHHQRCYNPPICDQNSSWHSSCSHQSCSRSRRSIYLD